MSAASYNGEIIHLQAQNKRETKKNHSNHVNSNGSYEGRERPRRTGEGENQRPPFPKETRSWRQRASHAEHSLFHLAGKTFTKAPLLQYNHENATTHGTLVRVVYIWIYLTSSFELELITSNLIYLCINSSLPYFTIKIYLRGLRLFLLKCLSTFWSIQTVISHGLTAI